jgi:DNA-binding MarR family transcriptional regulator
MIIETKNIPTSLSGGTLKLICVVGDSPGIHCSMAAELLGVSPAAVTQCADVAEVARLLERRPAEGDRRVRALHLTDIGEAVVEKLKPAMEEGR